MPLITLDLVESRLSSVPSLQTADAFSTPLIPPSPILRPKIIPFGRGKVRSDTPRPPDFALLAEAYPSLKQLVRPSVLLTPLFPQTAQSHSVVTTYTVTVHRTTERRRTWGTRNGQRQV